jgi:hypothetical protein
MCWMCSRLHSASQTADVNWVPRSEVMTASTPKRLTQPATKASAIVAASMFLTGMASTHLVDRSMMVKRYLKPSAEVGSGPTKSTWRCVNRCYGTGMLCVAAAGCSVTFPLWQVWQSRHHPATSAAHLRHTNLLNTRCLVARIPGCASPWMVANTDDLKAAGTSGRATPVDTSHRTSAPWICSRRTCKAGLAATFFTSGQDPCAAAIAA